MKLSEWESLSAEQREVIMRSWDIYSPGWWHELVDEAAHALAQECKDNPDVVRVYRVNHHGVLEIVVETRPDSKRLGWLNDKYRGIYRGLPVRQSRVPK